MLPVETVELELTKLYQHQNLILHHSIALDTTQCLMPLILKCRALLLICCSWPRAAALALVGAQPGGLSPCCHGMELPP